MIIFWRSDRNLWKNIFKGARSLASNFGDGREAEKQGSEVEAHFQTRAHLSPHLHLSSLQTAGMTSTETESR